MRNRRLDEGEGHARLLQKVSANLALFPFNNLANTAISEEGWHVDYGVVIDSLAGNDKIAANDDSGYNVLPPGPFGYCIYIAGTINTATGNDSITAKSNFTAIANFGTINSGSGDDKVKGFSYEDYGIFNAVKGKIATMGGDDRITGNGGDDGIYNFGAISTGNGDDKVIGIGRYDGIYNAAGKINTGAGNDIIIGRGGPDSGIYNSGEIITGAGNDIITGIGTYTGIVNSGTIRTGRGKDTVDALRGGFIGDGTVDLGAGRDTLKGFGAGKFHGGRGSDKILLGEGTYAITGSRIGGAMEVYEFELIGGINGGLFKLRDGLLKVDSDGLATFA